MNYSDESLEAEQMSNSKSEDTPDPSKVDELTDKLRKLLNKDGVWSSEYNSVLLEIEESATPEPPQYTTIHDVVNGTPKGQEAVQKAIDNSIKVQNEMTKKAQDTSLDDIVKFLCGEQALQGRWFNEKYEGIPTYWWRNHLRIAVAQQRAKLFEQIRSEVLNIEGKDDRIEAWNNLKTSLGLKENIE